MADYKLYYFNLRGRAEIIRLLFAAAGQKFEDIRFEREKWPEYKAKAPFGQSPYIEITENGQTITLAQSIAITRHLAQRFGLAGKSANESAIIDMYSDQMTDFVNELAKVFRESDPEKKKEIQEKLAKEVVPVQLKYFEERMAKSGSGFIAASGFTWIDLYLYVIVDWIPQKEQIFEAFKNIKAARDKIEAMKGISEWLKVRPVTDM